MVIIESVPLESNARTPAQSRSFDKAVVTIGRSPQADFFLDSDLISRLAIRVVVTAAEMLLEDVSDNGSTINGAHGYGTRPIRESDDIRIGPYRLVVRRRD